MWGPVQPVEGDGMILARTVPPFHAGDRFVLIKDTYDLEICDLCGKKRKCDWFEYDGENYTGIDVCRGCQKDVFKEEQA